MKPYRAIFKKQVKEGTGYKNEPIEVIVIDHVPVHHSWNNEGITGNIMFIGYEFRTRKMVCADIYLIDKYIGLY